MMRVLVLLVACAAASGCAGYLLGDRKAAPAASPETGTYASASDSAISGDIRARFSADDELSNYRIGISTVSGRVTLSGAVGSYTARDRATEIARTTGGVRAVDNRIVVNTNL